MWEFFIPTPTTRVEFPQTSWKFSAYSSTVPINYVTQKLVIACETSANCLKGLGSGEIFHPNPWKSPIFLNVNTSILDKVWLVSLQHVLFVKT